MDTNKPRTTEVTQAELELLEACRRSPHLAGNLTYLLDRYQAETNTGMDANQAEMSIVDIVRAMGNRLLTQWGEETHAEIAAKHFSNPGLIGNGKKTPLAQHLREHRNPSANLPLKNRRKNPPSLPRAGESDRLRLLPPAAPQIGRFQLATFATAPSSVLQKRLKKPGAWWHKPTAESMGQIKTLQANGHWENLWQKLAA
jgi:hypothetical protein